MPGHTWSDEEQCLIIWFASIGVAQATIVLLLAERGFSRTLGGVQNKISDIRKKFSLGNSSDQLVETKVDRWIDGFSIRIDTDKLLEPTLRDQYILDKYCTRVDLELMYVSRRSRRSRLLSDI